MAHGALRQRPGKNKMVDQAKHEREIGAAVQGEKDKKEASAKNDSVAAEVKKEMGELMKSVEALVQTLSKPKRIVRGPDGRASGVETVQ